MRCRCVKHVYALLALAVLGTGCSTTPITEQSGTPVPSSRIFKPEYTIRSAVQTAKVTFLRDRGILGVACTDRILVNGNVVFAMRAGEYLSVYLTPGRYDFGVETGGACPDAATWKRTVLADNAEETYRVMRPSDFSLMLARIE